MHIYILTITLFKIPNFFLQNWYAYSEIHMEIWKTWDSRNTLKYWPQNFLSLEMTVTKIVWYHHQDRKRNQWNRKESPKQTYTYADNCLVFFNAKAIPWRKDSFVLFFLINTARTFGINKSWTIIHVKTKSYWYTLTTRSLCPRLQK